MYSHLTYKEFILLKQLIIAMQGIFEHWPVPTIFLVFILRGKIVDVSDQVISLFKHTLKSPQGGKIAIKGLGEVSTNSQLTNPTFLQDVEHDRQELLKAHQMIGSQQLEKNQLNQLLTQANTDNVVLRKVLAFEKFWNRNLVDWQREFLLFCTIENKGSFNVHEIYKHIQSINPAISKELYNQTITYFRDNNLIQNLTGETFTFTPLSHEIIRYVKGDAG